MQRSLQQIRNIGIIAHIDAGKTTVTERMLYYSGAKHRVGRVDLGTAEADEDPEEQERGITIYSACLTFNWNDRHINLLDTPGHVDFTAEVERCLRVLDGAVVVFSAREGVEAQSETVWRQADKYHVPRLAFINKLDREGADFVATLEEIQKRLAAHPVALQIPVGLGPEHTKAPFRGVIDLVREELLTFENQEQGAKVTRQRIPKEMSVEAALWREKMLDELSKHSDELMMEMLEEEEIPVELIHEVIREATIAHQIQPVLCGSALKGMGVRPLLDAVAEYLPSPLDVPPVAGLAPHAGAAKDKRGKRSKAKAAAGEADETPAKKLVRHCDPQEPFAALVFKVLPAKTGDLYWIRIYSGALKANSRVLNPGQDTKENVAQIWYIHATKREQKVDEASAGDIVGVIGPRDSVTGDTLCDAKDPILLERIEFPETVISMAIEPEGPGDRKKLSETLDMMRRQDPTFAAAENEETGQTVISGMGELHLEVIKHRLLRDFNLNVKVHKPRVSYRETVGREAEATGQCHRMIAGQQLFAKVRVKLEPFEKAVEPLVISRVPVEELPGEFLTAAVEELESRAEGGGAIGGFPLSKLRVTLLGGEYNVENSSETAFRIAAADAFEEALKAAKPTLLEPIMRLNITTPDEYMGDFVGDLQQRRAIIAKTGSRGTLTTIEAHAPLAELFGYSSAMRSLSQGRAGCSLEPLEYAPAPPEVAEQFLL